MPYLDYTGPLRPGSMHSNQMFIRRRCTKRAKRWSSALSFFPRQSL